MKTCQFCIKEFMPARYREKKFCSIDCYQKSRRRKSSFSWFLFDGLILIVPIVLIAWAVYFITPKIETEIPDSSCDELVFYMDDDLEEDEKFWKEIKNKKRNH